jgi:hypothetical protein
MTGAERTRVTDGMTGAERTRVTDGMTGAETTRVTDGMTGAETTPMTGGEKPRVTVVTNETNAALTAALAWLLLSAFSGPPVHRKPMTSGQRRLRIVKRMNRHGSFRDQADR